MSEARRIWRLFAPYWRWMALAVLLSLTATLAGIALIAVSGWFIAAMGLAGAAGATINYFTPAAIIRALAIVRTGGRYAERVVGHEATLRLLAGLRSWLFLRLAPLAPFGLDTVRSGEMLARLRGDIDRLEAVFLRIGSPAVVALLSTAAVVAAIAVFSAPTALVELALLAAAGLVVPLVAARSSAASGKRVADATGRLDAALVDTAEGLAELQVYGAMAARTRRIEHLTDAIIAEETRLAGLSAVVQGGVTLASGLALVATLVIVAPAVTAGTLQPALLPMLALLAVAGFDALAALPAAMQSLSATLASARRLFDLADRPAPYPEPVAPAAPPTDSRLALRGVGLTYPGAHRPALSGIDLDLAPGRRVAVVGPNGSGKSSLVALASRFVAPDRGSITLGGVELSLLAGEDVRTRLSVAEQRGHLFAASIRDNLSIGRPEVGDTELEAACRLAQIHDVIAAQPAGYDTFVGNHGLQLSGGEARRIVVARALLSDAPLLILDEPTEGLDTATARALLEAVLAARRDRGILLITHRREALEQMDEIVRLDQGRIVARGAPSAVLPLLDG